MYNILIIDDEPIVKIALRSILPWEEHGFHICATASNGIEALTLVEQHHPQIIITDLKMPQMDGIELIRSLKEQNYCGEILVLSNYEDFEYVRNALLLGAVDYMLKVKIEADVLLQYLMKAVEKLKQKDIAQNSLEQNPNHLEMILKSFFYEKHSLDNFINKYPSYLLSFMHQPCSICSLFFEQELSEKREQHPLSETLIENTVLDALQGLEDTQVIPMIENQLLVIFSQPEPEVQKLSLQQFVQKLPNRFKLYHSLSPVILYYWNASDYENARTIYFEFENITQLRFYQNGTIFNIRETDMIHYLSSVQYKELGKEIHENGLNGMDQSLDILSAIIKRCSDEHVYPEILRLLFIKILQFLEFLKKNIDIKSHEFLSETKEAIYHCTTSQELMSYMTVSLQSIFEPLSDIPEHDSIQYREEIAKVTQYIEDNYQRKITLNSISSYVNLSLSYLCRIFKSEVGTSINNYINNLRMEKASAFITHENISVKEVAARVGIEDQLYFSRLFKKHFGVPPSEYNVHIENKQ